MHAERIECIALKCFNKMNHKNTHISCMKLLLSASDYKNGDDANLLGCIWAESLLMEII